MKKNYVRKGPQARIPTILVPEFDAAFAKLNTAMAQSNPSTETYIQVRPQYEEVMEIIRRISVNYMEEYEKRHTRVAKARKYEGVYKSFKLGY